MPIGDDLDRALRERRLGPDHIVLMHPTDFDRLRGNLADFQETPDGSTIFGTQVVSTPLQERGSIRIVRRPVVAMPPRIVIDPAYLSTLRAEVDHELREPNFIVASGTFQHPIFIPAGELGEEPVKEESPPKTLWQRLEEDD